MSCAKHSSTYFSFLCLTFAAVIAALDCTRVDPEGAVCYKHGYVKGERASLFAEPLQVQRITDCRDLCQRRSKEHPGNEPPRYNGCDAWTYNESTHECKLYLFSSSKHHLVKDESSELIVASERCDRCNLCPQAVGDQLLDNGDFDRNTNLFGPWENLFVRRGAVSAVAPGEGKNGSNAYLCKAKANGFCQIYQSWNMCTTPARYIVEFDYKTVAPKSQDVAFELGIDAPWPLGFYNYVYKQPTSTMGSWVHKKFFTNAQVSFPNMMAIFHDTARYNRDRPINPKQAKYYLDNVKVSPAPAFVQKAGSSNVFRNPGFESGTVAPWTAIVGNSESSTSVVQRDGGHALRFKPGRVQSSHGHKRFLLQQTLTTTPGSFYRVSFRASANKNSYLPIIYLFWGQWGKGKEADPFQPDNRDAVVGQYDSGDAHKDVTITRTFYADSKKTTFSLLILEEFDNTKDYYFDDFEAYELTEQE